jgi:hypothetical protein
MQYSQDENIPRLSSSYVWLDNLVLCNAYGSNPGICHTVVAAEATENYT